MSNPVTYEDVVDRIWLGAYGSREGKPFIVVRPGTAYVCWIRYVDPRLANPMTNDGTWMAKMAAFGSVYRLAADLRDLECVEVTANEEEG